MSEVGWTWQVERWLEAEWAVKKWAERAGPNYLSIMGLKTVPEFEASNRRVEFVWVWMLAMALVGALAFGTDLQLVAGVACFAGAAVLWGWRGRRRLKARVKASRRRLDGMELPYELLFNTLKDEWIVALRMQDSSVRAEGHRDLTMLVHWAELMERREAERCGGRSAEARVCARQRRVSE